VSSQKIAVLFMILMAGISDVSHIIWACIGYVLVDNSFFGDLFCQLLYSIVTDTERRMMVNNMGRGR
jgi:hypothetical protein